jgi:hypothetical protein
MTPAEYCHGRSQVKREEDARREADLRRYLGNRITLLPPELPKVVAAITGFASSVLREGFQDALTQLQSNIDNRPDRTFIELCDEIIEYHLQAVKQENRELVGKSLFEAYVYLAGPEYVFEPASKTRILTFLGRHGTKGFAALFLSLHLFNTICCLIRDDVHAEIPDQKAFEAYMFQMENLCREIVADAMKIPDAGLDKGWAATVCTNIENRILQNR